jgi:cation:H+ antiporter
MTYVWLALGVVMLVLGGDAFVRGSVAVAQRMGVSPLLIGLTLVGFGTSAPELVTSVQAALQGSPGIAVGNVVGSNIANVLLILGAAALIRPIRTTPAAFKRDGSVVVLAALACAGVVLTGEAGRLVGAAFVMALALYVGLTYRHERRVPDASAALHADEAALSARPMRVWAAAVLTVGGLVLVLLGANRLVAGAVELARTAGLSEAVVGLTVVAIGTSLPELVTGVMAAIRGQADVAFGNVVGSNIMNVLGILGATALVQPLTVPAEIAAVDIWVMLAATGLLVAVAVTGSRISRREGGAMLALYAGYVAWLVVGGAQ